MTKSAKKNGISQAGALCLKDGEVLLITSRDNGRWVIPKGRVEKNESHSDCAAREALEEAGIVGTVAASPLGHYRYIKDRSRTSVEVAVFTLTVTDQLSEFRESGQRSEIWLPPQIAADLVHEEGLKTIFRRMATDR